MRRSASRAQLSIGVAAMTLVAACSPGAKQDLGNTASVNTLVFLTRQGCVDTVTMRANLDEALRALGLPRAYQVVDADTLAASDARGGYGTPTLLYESRDVFGMPEPAVPHPPPT